MAVAMGRACLRQKVAKALVPFVMYCLVIDTAHMIGVSPENK